MTVRVLYGIQSAALRRQCLDEVFAFTGQWPDKRAIILVPEQAKLDFEQAYLQRSGSSGLLMAEVLSFRRLAARLAGEAGQLTGPQLNQTGQAMLLYRLLAESRPELKTYARLADKPGFLRQIQAVLGDLRRCQIDAATLADLAGQISDKTLQDKICDLSLLMARYSQAAATLELSDPETELDCLVTLLSQPTSFARTRLAWLKQTSVWVAGFGELRNFTPQEYAVLGQLAENCEQLTVSVLSDCVPADELAVETGPDLFLPGRRTAYQLQLRFRPLRSVRVLPDWKPAVARLAEHLGATAEWMKQAIPNERPDQEVPGEVGPFDLKTILADQSDDQATWLAGEIRRLVVEEGYRYRDIVIAVCDPSQDMPRLQAAFSQYSIPLFLDQVRSLAGTALLRTVLAVLDIAGQGFGRLPVMRMLRAGLLLADQSQADYFENHVLARGLFHLERLLEPESGEPENVRLIRETILLPIRQFAMHMRTARTGQERVDVLVSYLEESGLKQLTAQLVLRLQQAKDNESALAIAKSWNALVEVLGQLAHFTGETEMSLPVFRDLLSAGLDNADSGVLPTALDQVAIGNLAHARQRNGRILFVYNAQAGTFPPGLPPEGLLKDSDRLSLSILLGQTLPNNARDQVFANNALIFGLLTLPSDRLVLLAPARDMSPYFKRLSEWSGQPTIQLPTIPDWGDVRLNAPDAAMNRLIQVARQTLPDQPDLLDPYRPLALALQRQGYPADTRLARLEVQDPLDVHLDRKQVEARFGTTLQMSVSQLEKYAACPFQHLAAHGLVLREREIYEPQATDSGILLHFLAEQSLQLLQEELRSLPDDQARNARMDAWLSGELDNRLAGLMGQLREDPRLGLFFTPGLKASAGRRLERVARTSMAALLRQLQLESYTPALFEWIFEPQQGNALCLNLKGGHTVQLNGKIDRVDLQTTDDSSCFRIVDYKSGNQKVNYDALYHGLHLQLPAYLAAFRASHSGYRATDACYFHFDQPILRQEPEDPADPAEIIRQLDKRFAMMSLDLPPEQLPRLQSHTLEKIRHWAGEIVRGEFSARPRQVQNLELPCAFCIYRSVCGFDPKQDSCQRFQPLGRSRTNMQEKLSRKDDFMYRLEQEQPAVEDQHAAD